MARADEELPLECPVCGGDIRLIAFITEPEPIRKILTHLGEPREPPPLAPAGARRPSGARSSRLISFLEPSKNQAVAGVRRYAATSVLLACSYTIVGGSQIGRINKAFVLDYVLSTESFLTPTYFAPRGEGADIVSHFEGVSGLGNGSYSLVGMTLDSGSNPTGVDYGVATQNPIGSLSHGGRAAIGACLSRDRDVLLAFGDLPAEHWGHVRITNPIESTLSTIRLRHRRTKGSWSRRASRRWRSVASGG